MAYFMVSFFVLLGFHGFVDEDYAMSRSCAPLQKTVFFIKSIGVCRRPFRPTKWPAIKMN
jgi:hypothetical protein